MGRRFYKMFVKLFVKMMIAVVSKKFRRAPIFTTKLGYNLPL